MLWIVVASCSVFGSCGVFRVSSPKTGFGKCVTWFDAYIFEKYLSKASVGFPTVRKIRSYFTLKGVSTR